MDRLAGKLAVITGIGPGIGSAIARRFVREGANLVLAGFANPAFEETTEFLRRSGARVAVVHGDVGRRTIWDQIARDADAQFGRVHIVVNSAATGRFAPILDIPEDEWDETMRTNLKSVYFSCQTFIPRMIAAGGGDDLADQSAARGAAADDDRVEFVSGLLKLAEEHGVVHALTDVEVCSTRFPSTLSRSPLTTSITSRQRWRR
jgi:NAD(P)-dependent dehydrogenase (short-subunit alcohol dehydrogenase family)